MPDPLETLVAAAAKAVYDDIDGGWSMEECEQTAKAVLDAIGYPALLDRLRALEAVAAAGRTLIAAKNDGEWCGGYSPWECTFCRGIRETHEPDCEWVALRATLAALGERP